MIIAFHLTDILTVLFLVFLEGILSLDNALVLACAVKHLPKEQQKKALSYGIWGAFLFRFCALFFMSELVELNWVKIFSALYLGWIALNHFIRKSTGTEKTFNLNSFWITILTIEMLDIAFSVDSIFAAMAVRADLLIMFIGGVLGIIMMRFAARHFVVLIERHKKLESLAYLIILGLGLKLGIQAMVHY